ncbi:MAG: hypothetical protein Q9166_007445 [cf. Caloplaca sp. 2 TL-2023]
MDSNAIQVLKWSSQLSLLPVSQTVPLRGDKIILPPSTLEQLLSAATVTVPSTHQPQTSSFDSYNPYSYAAEQQARAQLFERQQELPHPLTFRLVNPLNGRVCYAGIREFSAAEGSVGLSHFLRHSLGFDEPHATEIPKVLLNGNSSHEFASDGSESKLTVHFETLPKGTYVRLRPLVAGYDPEDWKALLEKHLRDNFTTLTNGEVLTVASGKEEYRFLVDDLKPNDKAITLVDTDLEVDIEPLNEEQARETLKQRALKAQRAPGTAEGSSPGGPVHTGGHVSGQVRPGEYVDYSIEEWDRNLDINVELLPADDEQDVDLFITPAGPKQRAKPREEEHVFGDFSSNPSKRIKVKHTNAELDNAEALWISVRGYEHNDLSSSSQSTAPIPYILRVTSNASSTNIKENSMPNSTVPKADEELCSNCQQPVPHRTMFLHKNFCLRNNIACPNCHNVFHKTSHEWKNHWHCPHDSSYGNSPSSQGKHDRLYHRPQTCPACATPCLNIPDLAHHRTTTCPSKPILCQFCHLLVPQRGPDDPNLMDPEVLMSGLTPHELIDGARTTECHLCSKIVRLRDMSTHLKHHAYERQSRTKPIICNNKCCGRTLVGYFSPDGKRTTREGGGRDNPLGICNTCFGPLYANTYDPEGKQLRRRVERRYLTQMMTGCGKEWCRNTFCKSGRSSMGLEPVKGSKDIMVLVKPMLDGGGVSFCTDEGSQRRREMGEMVAAERGEGDGFVSGSVQEVGMGKGKEKVKSGEGGGYKVEWVVNALEVEGGDLLKARGWLQDWAVTRQEEAAR